MFAIFMNWDLISAVVFYSIVAILIFKYRHKIQIMQKIFIVYKTKKGLNFMRKLAKYRTFWKVFSTIAIPISVLGMIIVGQSLFVNLIKIFQGVGGQGVGLLIPGVRIPGSSFYVPFWPGIIAIAVLAVVHEFSHGIVAAMEGIKLKSTGFGLLAILPLAFVELDEKQMAKKSRLARLRVAAAGPFANLVTWLVLTGVIMLLFAPALNHIVVYDGLNITSVEDNSPAQLAGIHAGIILTSINNHSVRTIDDFLTAVKEIKPGDNVTVVASNETYVISTIANPGDESKPYMGVLLVQSSHISNSVKEKYGISLDAFLWIFEVVKWVALINLFVGLINCIPVWAIDGGRILYDLFGYVIKDEKVLAIILHIFSSFYVSLIILNFIGPAIVHFIY